MSEESNRTSIHVGDRVRSYDFPDLPSMKETCFVEGVVEAIGPVTLVGGPDFMECGGRVPMSCIGTATPLWLREGPGAPSGNAASAPSAIAAGSAAALQGGRKSCGHGRGYPPVNGIPTWLGGVTRGVEKVESNPQTKGNEQ